MIAVPFVEDTVVNAIVDTKMFQAKTFTLRFIKEEQLFKI